MPEVPITNSGLLIGASLLCGSLTVYLLSSETWRRLALTFGGLAAGGLIGLGVFWFAVDVRDLFGVTLSDLTRLWVVLGFAGIGLSIVNLFRTRWWRKTVAAIAVVIFAMTSALQINADFGAFQNLSQVFGKTDVAPLEEVTGERGEVVAGLADFRDWQPPKDMPAHGQRGAVMIPGATSGFPARQAIVWLPPAALVDHPPVLPVLIAMSGQPGGPYANFDSGHMDEALDRYQAAHHGIAPILVAADQLSAGDVNPMCVDSHTLGNSASYMTIDVPNWVRAHYRVSSDPKMWGLTGFSQGGTCVSQFMAGHPEIFGSGIATLSEIGPRLSSIPEAVQKGFGGSQAAFDAAQPIAIMQAHGRYRDTMLLFGSGEKDQRYTGYARELHAAARAAGMQTELILEPAGHDWHTTQAVFDRAFPLMAARMGIDRVGR
ncbi:hypothetical protein JD292_07195 [Leucobacter sp. CSA2]|uniref:Esterase n=1 Tax=Leucobacter edaphi TaxID=2796472 RepID=A0A934QEJ6_9MICO|nr:alpha/beta hydrolase-fold protein [Leucobacter edaphi]MBK0421857.1 hypothetical protein [Leucobacter edaphi]